MNKANAGGTYRIRVYGTVDPGWFGLSNGLRLTFLAAESGVPASELTGWIPDQAALIEILNRLFSCRCALLSLTCLDADGGDLEETG